MPYDCNIQEHQGHVRVEVSEGWATPGEELKDAIGALRQIDHFCNKKRIFRILAIWNVPGHLPAVLGHDIVASATRTKWGFNFKMAVVYSHKGRFKDALFMEKVAIYHGYKVKMFGDEQEAKSWLLET